MSHALPFFPLLVVSAFLGIPAAQGALTVEEALTLSQQTGRPIFAVAGTQT